MISLQYLLVILIFATIEAQIDSIESKPNVLSEKCPNNALNSFLEFITPEDYEEVKVSDIYKRVKHINQTIDKFERLQNVFKNISEKFDPIVSRLSARITELLMEIELPNECMTALVRIATGIQSKKQWAMKFIDTFPAPNSGQSMPSIGYDECLEFEIPEYELNSGEKISGQYCWSGIPNLLPEKNEENIINDTIVKSMNDFYQNTSSYKSMPQSRFERTKFKRAQFFDIFVLNNFRKTFATKLPLGLCIPSTCKAQDIEYALNKVLYPIIRLPIAINPDCDYLNKPVIVNSYQRITILVFTVLISLVFISTIHDLYIKYFYLTINANKKQSVFTSQISQTFSAINNFKNIFWWDRPNKKLRMLDGLRAILAFVILLCHEHEVALLPFHSKGMAFVTRGFFSRNYMHIKNFNVVDTFFFLGGIMTCYVMLSKLHKSNGRFNYFQYAFVRYLRIVPVTFGSILLIYIFPLLGNGPNWIFATSILYVPCRDNWLPSVLMTSNFDISLPDKFICNVGNWSISTDFQLYLLAPIIFLVLYYSPKIGVIWNMISIVIGVLICLAPKVIWGIPHFMEYPEVDSIWTYTHLMIPYYWRSDPHFISYVMGILCGYLIRQKPDLYFGGRIGELVLWITTSLLTFWSIWWTNDLWDPFNPLPTTELLLYLAFSKPLYLSGWFWMIYACATGRGGFVNQFFSWKGFKPFAVLSFEISVLHLMLIFYRIGIDREQVIYSAYYAWTNACFDYLLAFLLSIVFYIVVSAPFANLVHRLVKTNARVHPIELDENNNKIA